MCFAEHCIVMLASVLNSNRAIQASIRIVKIYIRMREQFLTNKDLLIKMEQFDIPIWKIKLGWPANPSFCVYRIMESFT